jgi:hypothetical protein
MRKTPLRWNYGGIVRFCCIVGLCELLIEGEEVNLVMKREVEVWKSWNPNVMCGLGFEIEDWMKMNKRIRKAMRIFFLFMLLFFLKVKRCRFGSFFMKNKMIVLIFKNNKSMCLWLLSINLFLTLQKLECKR